LILFFRKVNAVFGGIWRFVFSGSFLLLGDSIGGFPLGGVKGQRPLQDAIREP